MYFKNCRLAQLLFGCLALASTACLRANQSRVEQSRAIQNERDKPADAVQTTRVSTGGMIDLGRINAILAHQPGNPVKGLLIISPGAAIPADKMVNLASKFAQVGYPTFVVEYLANLAIIPTEQKKSLELAKKIRRGEKLRGIPEQIERSLDSGASISLLGHSMGGAVLAGLADDEQSSFLKRILLVGVSSVVSAPISAKANVPISLLVGSEDGLVTQGRANEPSNEKKEMEALLQRKSVMLQGVNHFCIIDDENTGDAKKRAEEKRYGYGRASISQDECQNRLVDSVLSEGI